MSTATGSGEGQLPHPPWQGEEGLGILSSPTTHDRQGWCGQLSHSQRLMASSSRTLFTGSTLLCCVGESLVPFFPVLQLVRRWARSPTCYRRQGARGKGRRASFPHPYPKWHMRGDRPALRSHSLGPILPMTLRTAEV